MAKSRNIEAILYNACSDRYKIAYRLFSQGYFPYGKNGAECFPEIFQPRIPGIMPLFNVFNISEMAPWRKKPPVGGTGKPVRGSSWNNGDIVSKKGLLFGCTRYNHTAIH